MFDYCFSMLLPLETLPGWPEVTDPGLGSLLFVTLAVPGVISLIVVLLVMGPVWFRRLKTEGDTPGSSVAVRARD